MNIAVEVVNDNILPPMVTPDDVVWFVGCGVAGSIFGKAKMRGRSVFGMCNKKAASTLV